MLLRQYIPLLVCRSILDQQLLFHLLLLHWPQKQWGSYPISDQGKRLLGVVLPACYCQIHESLHLSWWGWPVDLLGHLYNERGESPLSRKGHRLPGRPSWSSHLQIEVPQFLYHFLELQLLEHYWYLCQVLAHDSREEMGLIQKPVV